MVLILLYQIFSVFQCSKMSFVLFGTVSQCCDTTSILDGFIFKTAERKSASTPGEPKPGQSWSPFPSFAYRVSYRSPLTLGPDGEHVLNFLESFKTFAPGRLCLGLLWDRGEWKFPFPVIPGNTSLKFPFPPFSVAFCKFPSRSREKEVLAGN